MSRETSSNMLYDKDIREPLFGFLEETYGKARILEEKPAFREDWRRHRCIVPASYYYEWEHVTDNAGKKHTGDKYIIQPKMSEMTWMCGLYRFEENMPVFVILTREPGKDIAYIHDRMPVILPEHLLDSWIRPDGNPEELVGEALVNMEFEKTEF